MEAIATGLEAIAIRLEAIATGLEAIAIRLEAITTRLEAIATKLEAMATRLEATTSSSGQLHRLQRLGVRVCRGPVAPSIIFSCNALSSFINTKNIKEHVIVS